MKWNDIYNYYKNKYSEYLILYKIGNFYNVIGVDIYIMKYIFDYKIIINNSIEKIGFPMSNLNKVMDELNKLKINYLTIDKEEGIAKVNYKKRFKDNNYNKYYINSKSYCDKKDKINIFIDLLNQKINDPNFDSIIKSLEEVLNER